MGPADLAQVRELLARHPDWSRYRLSRELARRWEWRSAAGQLKDMASRSLLLKLEQRGWISLPPCRRASPNRMRHKRPPALPETFRPEPVPGPLAALRPLNLSEASAGPATARALLEGLLHRYHYLSHRSPVGENLQYLVRERAGRAVACLLFGAAAWQCADRDRHIGWDRTTREAGLHLIANNTRFLILPMSPETKPSISRRSRRPHAKARREQRRQARDRQHLAEEILTAGQAAEAAAQAAATLRRHRIDLPPVSMSFQTHRPVLVHRR